MKKAWCLSPNEEARLIQEEQERRRKLRIVQVRQQAKKNAANIRNAVQQEKDKQINKLKEQIKKEWEAERKLKLQKLEATLVQSLKAVGQAHREAQHVDNQPNNRDLVEKENQTMALIRHKVALQKLQADRDEQEEQDMKHIVSRQEALDVEKIRAADVAARPPPLQDPVDNIEPLKVRPVKFTDLDAFSLTHLHIPQDCCVERASSPELQVDAKELAAEKEVQLNDAQEEKKRTQHERTEKARLRGKAAVSKEILKHDYTQMLHDLSDLQRADMQRRQQVVAHIPKQIFVAPHKRQEEREERQQDMEHAFEDMYMAATEFIGDLSLALDPHPAPDTPAASDILDLTTDDAGDQLEPTLPEDTQTGSLGVPVSIATSDSLGPVLRDVTNMTERGQQQYQKQQTSDGGGGGAGGMLGKIKDTDTTLRKLFDRIKVQRDRWSDKTSDEDTRETVPRGQRVQAKPHRPSVAPSMEATLTQYTMSSEEAATEETASSLETGEIRSQSSAPSTASFQPQSSEANSSRTGASESAGSTVTATDSGSASATLEEGTLSSSSMTGSSRASPPAVLEGHRDPEADIRVQLRPQALADRDPSVFLEAQRSKRAAEEVQRREDEMFRIRNQQSQQELQKQRLELEKTMREIEENKRKIQCSLDHSSTQWPVSRQQQYGPASQPPQHAHGLPSPYAAQQGLPRGSLVTADMDLPPPRYQYYNSAPLQLAHGYSEGMAAPGGYPRPDGASYGLMSLPRGVHTERDPQFGSVPRAFDVNAQMQQQQQQQQQQPRTPVGAIQGRPGPGRMDGELPASYADGYGEYLPRMPAGGTGVYAGRPHEVSSGMSRLNQFAVYSGAPEEGSSADQRTSEVETSVTDTSQDIDYRLRELHAYIDEIDKKKQEILEHSRSHLVGDTSDGRGTEDDHLTAVKVIDDVIRDQAVHGRLAREHALPADQMTSQSSYLESADSTPVSRRGGGSREQVRPEHSSNLSSLAQDLQRALVDMDSSNAGSFTISTPKSLTSSRGPVEQTPPEHQQVYDAMVRLQHALHSGTEYSPGATGSPHRLVDTDASALSDHTPSRSAVTPEPAPAHNITDPDLALEETYQPTPTAFDGTDPSRYISDESSRWRHLHGSPRLPPPGVIDRDAERRRTKQMEEIDRDGRYYEQQQQEQREHLARAVNAAFAEAEEGGGAYGSMQRLQRVLQDFESDTERAIRDTSLTRQSLMASDPGFQPETQGVIIESRSPPSASAGLDGSGAGADLALAAAGHTEPGSSQTLAPPPQKKTWHEILLEDSSLNSTDESRRSDAETAAAVPKEGRHKDAEDVEDADTRWTESTDEARLGRTGHDGRSMQEEEPDARSREESPSGRLMFELKDDSPFPVLHAAESPKGKSLSFTPVAMEPASAVAYFTGEKSPPRTGVTGVDDRGRVSAAEPSPGGFSEVSQYPIPGDVTVGEGSQLSDPARTPGFSAETRISGGMHPLLPVEDHASVSAAAHHRSDRSEGAEEITQYPLGNSSDLMTPGFPGSSRGQADVELSQYPIGGDLTMSGGQRSVSLPYNPEFSQYPLESEGDVTAAVGRQNSLQQHSAAELTQYPWESDADSMTQAGQRSLRSHDGQSSKRAMSSSPGFSLLTGPLEDETGISEEPELTLVSVSSEVLYPDADDLEEFPMSRGVEPTQRPSEESLMSFERNERALATRDQDVGRFQGQGQQGQSGESPGAQGQGPPDGDRFRHPASAKKPDVRCVTFDDEAGAAGGAPLWSADELTMGHQQRFMELHQDSDTDFTTTDSEQGFSSVHVHQVLDDDEANDSMKGISLQEAFRRKKAHFAHASADRQAHVKVKAEQQQQQQQHRSAGVVSKKTSHPASKHGAISKTLSSWKKSRSTAGARSQPDPTNIVERTSKDRKSSDTEMKQRTSRLYSQLEEVKDRKTEQDRKEEYAQNREKAREYHKKHQEHLKKKDTKRQ